MERRGGCSLHDRKGAENGECVGVFHAHLTTIGCHVSPIGGHGCVAYWQVGSVLRVYNGGPGWSLIFAEGVIGFR